MKYGCILVEEEMTEDICIRCGGDMVHIGFKIYRCSQCGHEEKPEDIA
jgi:tRNA(Ile2) C34 agmatinyltransferase TiaS